MNLYSVESSSRIMVHCCGKGKDSPPIIPSLHVIYNTSLIMILFALSTIDVSSEER